MDLSTSIIHHTVIAIVTAIAALGVSIGQGITSRAGIDAINRQPAAATDINRATLLALAIIETGAILGLLISFILFFQPQIDFNMSIAQIGIALASAIPGLVTGIAAGFPAQQALIAISRQPFIAKKITNFMLLTLSLIQTPLIFGFLIVFIIRNQMESITTLGQALILVAAGISIGLGSIGPSLGIGHFTRTSYHSLGVNRSAYSKLFTFTFISQAIIGTPIIFAAIISFILITKASVPLDNTLLGFAYIIFACTMGIGTFGAGISSGRSAAAAATQIAEEPTAYNMLARSSIMAQGLIDTSAVYAFIISLWLILSPLL